MKINQAGAIAGLAIAMYSTTAEAANTPKNAGAAAAPGPDAAACVKAINENQIVLGVRCSDVLGIHQVNVVDQRSNGDTVDELVDITFILLRQSSPQSLQLQACSGVRWSTPVSQLSPGTSLPIEMQLHFEKWSSGWRCTNNKMLSTGTPPAEKNTGNAAGKAGGKLFNFLFGK